MRHPLPRALLALLLLSPSGLSAQADEWARARVVPITGSFPTLALTPGRVIPDALLNVETISRIAVSPSGTIIVADTKPVQLLAFPAGGGRRAIGRAGEGPREYRRIASLGWQHDTLVLLDDRIRRFTRFSVSTGTRLNSWPYARGGAAGDLVELLRYGTGTVAVRSLSTGAPVPFPIGGGTGPAAPAYTFVEVHPLGLGDELERLVDSARYGPPGIDCEDRKGVIHILATTLFPDRNSVRAFGPSGELITARHDSIDLLVRTGARGPATRLVRAGGRIRLSQALWESSAREYLDLVKANGPLVCTEPMDRPVWLPMVRGIATDDRGQIWIETTTADGGGMLLGVTIAGVPIGQVALPARDESVPWIVRGDRLYLVTKDADDLQTVREYTITRAP